MSEEEKHDPEEERQDNQEQENEEQQEQPEEATAAPESFRERLTGFFEEYRPAKLKHVDTIVERFSDHEEQVMQHLDKKYGETRKRKLQGQSGGDDSPLLEDEGKGKKRPKTVLIVIFIVVLATVAGGIYMFKDDLMGTEPGDTPGKIDDEVEEMLPGTEEEEEAPGEDSEAEMAPSESEGSAASDTGAVESTTPDTTGTGAENASETGQADTSGAVDGAPAQ